MSRDENIDACWTVYKAVHLCKYTFNKCTVNQIFKDNQVSQE